MNDGSDIRSACNTYCSFVEEGFAFLFAISILIMGKCSEGSLNNKKPKVCMNNKKISVLALAIVFTVGAHAAFDQLGVSIYNDDAENYFFVNIDLPDLQLVSSSVASFKADYSMPLMPVQDDGVEEVGVSVTVTAVPVPPSLWFFGSALVALTVIQRRV